MLRSESLLAARQSSGLAAGDTGILLDPNGYIVESASHKTSFGAGLLDDALGLVGTAQNFMLTAPGSLWGLFPTIVRVPWRLEAAAGGGAAFGTMTVSLKANDVVIATGQGAPRDLTAVGSEYVEIIELVPTQSVTVSGGQQFGIEIQPIVTTASGAGGSTFEPQLNHDPQTTDKQLVMELQASELADKANL